jgi:hypothetical protein
MAVCDYCGATYHGGAIKDGAYRYCTGLCHERGSVLLRKLDHIPQNKIDSFIVSQHQGPCPRCGKNSSIDVHKSYRIWSALVYAQWQTNEFIACKKCARAQQLADLSTCIAAGWWSPHGFFVTPFFVIFNIAARLRHHDPATPSDRFSKLARLILARHLANQEV